METQVLAQVVVALALPMAALQETVVMAFQVVAVVLITQLVREQIHQVMAEMV
jgi:hypothetical protein